MLFTFTKRKIYTLYSHYRISFSKILFHITDTANFLLQSATLYKFFEEKNKNKMTSSLPRISPEDNTDKIRERILMGSYKQVKMKGTTTTHQVLII